jgi:glycine dehydrogenase
MDQKTPRASTPQEDRALSALENRAEFLARHIGPNEAQIDAMLGVLGHANLDELAQAIVPASIRLGEPLKLEPPVSEAQALERIRALAQDNQVLRSFIGAGYFGTILPTVIARNVFENPAWYTAYTPYQAEISQGRLEAMLNFQTLIGELTAMPIANASMLDEGTAAAEAMMLARRSSRVTANRFFVSEQCHPQTIAVVRTRAEPVGIEIVVGDAAVEVAPASEAFFGVLLQYPASTGDVIDHAGTAQRWHAVGAMVAVAVDLLALTLLAPPGRWGADIVVGSAQRFGVPMGYGGPHAGFFACREEFKRSMPGRLVGVSVDAQGHPALRLALQTREQHIRREKATSNICTAQVLLAVIAAMYAVYHGPEGLRRIALRIHRLTTILAAGLRAAGLQVNGAFFDTLRVDGVDAASVHSTARAAGMNLRDLGAASVGISLDETSGRDDVRALWAVFGVQADLDALERSATDALPPALQRSADFLKQSVFHRHRSETAMLRYLRELADRDLALDRSMIPLGSCTMKLNATSEMIPVSWPQFAGLHPHAPAAQAAGYRTLIGSLEDMLAECTGYDRVSLQPNSGAQGEFAGLLAIRAYHRAQGQVQRDICLIPESAHGTNPASATLAGMHVVVVSCDAQGNIDIVDLEAKARQHAERLAALMVTYPSTHGVFEESICRICDTVHHFGGQVYVDGANLNALVGLAKPGWFGGDVSHLNLHKTFCIPHGGGGPGVGPVAVKAHLAPYLPAGFSATGQAQSHIDVGMVSAATYGSASILPISWMYLTMMGAEGLKRATQVALLNANYLARRLAPHYPILFSGRNGYVAHECILDLRPIKEQCGIGAEDVAKRLMDYGFHAPTLSFPVPGTLMVEPTESESQVELDRFVDAMVCIRAEIEAVASGALDRQDNPLRNAPHTAAMVTADRWDHPYSREQAGFPTPGLRRAKYWPPVARIDNVYGDRNLVCACAPTADWAETKA